MINDLFLLLVDCLWSKYVSNKMFDVMGAHVGGDVAAACF